MEKLKTRGKDNHFNIISLQEKVSHLRMRRGRYISATFAADIYKLYKFLSAEIQKCTQSSIEEVTPNFWVMPDNMVDCCLRCIEEILHSLVHKQRSLSQSKVLNELKDVAQDFYGLYLYIRYGVNPQEFKALS